MPRVLRALPPPFFWRFNLLFPLRKQPLLPRFEQELYSDFHSGFQAAYSALLHSLVTFDSQILSDALESRLNRRVATNLHSLKEKKWTLETVNPTAAVSLSLWNAKIHVHPPPRRQKSEKIETIYPVYYNVSDSEEEESEDSEREEPRLRPSDILVWEGNQEKTAVLTVDCLYSTCQKLVLRGGNKEILRGTVDTSIEQHLVRYETHFQVKRPSSLSGYFLDGEGESPISSFTWTATDIDYCLLGNPFASRCIKLPFLF